MEGRIYSGYQHSGRLAGSPLVTDDDSIVLPDGRKVEVHLQRNERKLYDRLTSAPIKVFPTEELLEDFGSVDNTHDSSFIPRYIKSLRQKIGYGFISTIKTRGYTLTSNDRVATVFLEDPSAEELSTVPRLQYSTEDGMLTHFLDRNFALLRGSAKKAFIDLSYTEAEYLRLLMNHPDKVYSSDAVHRVGNTRDSEPARSNVPAVIMSRLGHKLAEASGKQVVYTHRERGYSLMPARTRCKRQTLVFQR